MNYRFKKVFIGTLYETQDDRDIYKGDILCAILKNNVAIDLLNYQFYDCVGTDNVTSIENGVTYVVASSEYCSNIGFTFSKNTLVKCAQRLNEDWTNISIPESGISRIKRRV